MGKVKVGLDYFSLDTTMESDIRLIEAEYGLKGFGVVVKLWQRIYGERGYYIEWNDEIELLFADEVKVGRSFVSDIVRAAIKRGIFHQGMFEEFGILTSHGIQKRYLHGTSRRVRVEMEKRYLLLTVPEIEDNVYIIEENVCRNAENVYRFPQSRESRESRESKVERVEKSAHGKYKNVFLSAEEFEDLKKRFPADYQKKIDRLSTGIETKGYQYQNHHATIISWAEEDSEREKKAGETKKSRFNNYDDTNYVDYAAMEEKILDDMGM